MDESELGRSIEKISIQSSCLSGEALSLVQPSDFNGNTSTASSYLDSDYDDEPNPSELYGMYTWKIETFSQINKRELQSNAFEIGGCKWSILTYPQGCEVGNYLSLFLCVANHDKLPSGWSHFALFTLSLMNKDPKKSKYADTSLRFMKEEYDWGWKKYMELSKLTGGFIDSDTLIIKAQVQVIRERADQSFRCLGYEYRNELVRVYLTNAETVSRRFVEERRVKLERLLADKAWWSSFSAFWLGMDQNTRQHMSMENANTLEGRGKCNKGKSKSLDTGEVPGPIVLVQKGMFVLGDNLLLLLRRAASKPLPPKGLKGPQNCMNLGRPIQTAYKLTDQAVPFSSTSSQMICMSKSDTQKAPSPKPTEKALTPSLPVMSRPSSAPLIPGPRPTAPAVSVVQTAPLLARSVSAAGRLGPDPSPATHSYVPQSYRNAIIGNHVGCSSASFTHPNSPSAGVNPSPAYSQPAPLVSAPVFMPQSSERINPNSVQSGMVTRYTLQNGPQWMESSRAGRSMHCDPSPLLTGIQNLDLCQPVQSESREQISTEVPACKSGRQTQAVVADEFPHLDIINDLLDEEHVIGKVDGEGTVFQCLSNDSHPLNGHLSFSSEMRMSGEMGSSSGSCRIERAQSYRDDGFQRGYGSMGQFDAPREFIPQASPLPYANGQIDGLIPAQGQMASTDLSLLGMRNSESDGYPYFSTDYSNLTCGVNGYTVFRPSNGH
ncbi:hypothetical protein SLA2020_162450 [Shorea laevis]